MQQTGTKVDIKGTFYYIFMSICAPPFSGRLLGLHYNRDDVTYQSCILELLYHKKRPTTNSYKFAYLIEKCFLQEKDGFDIGNWTPSKKYANIFGTICGCHFPPNMSPFLHNLMTL